MLLLAVVALLPRVLDLGIFVTHDEVEFWIDRSETFLLALQSGDYAATAISTHPGVTTMWLGTIGIFLRRLIRAWDIVQEVPFPLLLGLMQLPVALTHVSGILIGYGLLRRLFTPAVALLAALFWAADPFVIGYSRLLHVDALTSTFATVSLLAACVFWNHTPRYRWLLLSACAGGLAILSKSPALLLLPTVGLLAIAAAWQDESPHATGNQGMLHRARRSLLSSTKWLLIWGAGCALTITLVWPAVWADPLRVIELFRVGIEVEGANPHMTGNFFLGQENPAPGPLFYPVALPLRMTPWTLIGLFLLPLAWRQICLTPPRSQSTRNLAVLAGWILLFTLAMSIFPKKFNRYLVPVFPSLDILAALGWVGLLRILQHTTGQRLAHSLQNHAGTLVFIPVALVALTHAMWYHPYSIVYFNQFLGGPQKGAETFSVGWGEGYDQVAAWLNQQADITGVVTAAIMVKTLNPYLRHGAQATTPDGAELPDKTGYVVVSIYQAQGTVFPPFDQFYSHVEPLHTVTLHNVDYFWIYQAPPEVAEGRVAEFGSSIRLRGFEMQNKPQAGTPLRFKLFWHILQPPPEEYWLFAHIIGPDGQRVGQIDKPYPTSAGHARPYITTELPIMLPAEAPAGLYQVTLGLYNPRSGARIPLTGTNTAPPALDGPNALLLTEVVLDQS